ncbi:MAG: SDR family oxidoreductase [Chitinophagaceae bacterium]|nr:SDR family oxidoreductase [Chitinophagaceae bacterium]
MEKILVTGANGLLGQSIIRQLSGKNYKVVATGRGPDRIDGKFKGGYFYEAIDITDGPAIEKFILDQRPDIIVHAAAMTQVDQCELNKQDCYNINVTATRFIIDAAKAINARFVFVSTDFVFDGNNGPYTEGDEPAPVNYYGSTKMVAEKAVMESGLNWAIARTILVYGVAPTSGRSNIIGFVKDNLEAKKPIRMVTDQVRTPTFVDDLAAGILLIIEKKKQGIYHLSGEEVMTPYDIAIEAAKYFGLNQELISRSTSEEIKQPAVRPVKTGFNISKAKKELGYQPKSFREGLEALFG